MQTQHIRWAIILTYLGAVPFILAVAAPLFGMASYHTAYLVLTYGAVIISFLAGIHWGLFLSYAESARINLLVSSNVIALLAWGSLLLLLPVTQFLIQMLCLVALLLIDRQLHQAAVISDWFFRLRTQITALVMLCQTLLLFSQY